MSAAVDAGTKQPAPGRVAGWHPGWLGVVLGTGGAAAASLADPLPFTRADDVIGALLTVVACVLLPVLAVPYALRLRRHRQALLADLTHPGMGALFGTLPASVLITALALAQLAVIGWLPRASAWLVLVLLVLGAFGAVLIGVEFFVRVVRSDTIPAPALSGAWFIPIVVLVLVPSVVVRLVALEPGWRSTSAVLAAGATWGAGLLLFLLLAPVLAWRLITAPAPTAAQAPSWWIWLAPAGAGGLGAIALTRLLDLVLGTETGGRQTAGLLVATALWGFATWWALFAGRVLVSLSRSNGGVPFHLGSWGFAFPTAAMAALTVELGRSWDVPAVGVAGAAGWVATLLVWSRLAYQTTAGVRSGALFTR